MIGPRDATREMLLCTFGVLHIDEVDIADVEDELLAREYRQIEAEQRQRDQVRRAERNYLNYRAHCDANSGYWPRGMD